MAWKLFVDDERTPLYDFADALHAHDAAEAVKMIQSYGLPEAISFDHDLGADSDGNPKPSAHTFMTWLIDQHLEGALDLSQVRKVVIHTNNVVGSKNLAGLWDCFARVVITDRNQQVFAELRPRKGLNE